MKRGQTKLARIYIQEKMNELKYFLSKMVKNDSFASSGKILISGQFSHDNLGKN
jgi:hypothetical protein